MPSIQIKHHSSIYEVEYEYHPSQKGDFETQSFGEAYVVKEIREVLNDGELSEDMYGDFEPHGIAAIEKLIAKEVKSL